MLLNSLVAKLKCLCEYGNMAAIVSKDTFVKGIKFKVADNLTEPQSYWEKYIIYML